MNTYIYNAAIYCEDCATDIIDKLKAENIADEGDSDSFPQGPYPDGGGESDSPEHCDNCNCFLENELTPDGRDYVLNLIRENITNKRGSTDILEEWIDYYNITIEELLNK